MSTPVEQARARERQRRELAALVLWWLGAVVLVVGVGVVFGAKALLIPIGGLMVLLGTLLGLE